MLRRRTMMAPIGDQNTITLLHFDNNLNNSTDISQTWVSLDDTSSYSSSIKKFGSSTYSIYGIQDVYPNVPNDICNNNENIYYDYLSSDWTAEIWVYFPTSYAYTRQKLFGFGCAYTGNEEMWSNDAYGYFHMQIGPSSILLTHSTDGTGSNIDFVQVYPISTFSKDVWHHVAVVKKDNVLTIYLNGNAVVSNVPWAYTPNVNFIINYIAPGARIYIDEFRFSNIARWTSNFTPPTAPY